MDELTRAVEMLLNISRNEIRDRNPEQALAALLHAVRLTRGEGAIMEVLDRAKARASMEMEQSFAHGRLEEAHRMTIALMEQETLLSERGEQEILKDAFEDGSSVVCTKCGGLVARARWDSHNQYWCPELPPSDGD